MRLFKKKPKPVPFDVDLLLPGDAILYLPTSFFGYGIAIKTFTWRSHVEVYIGDKLSIASRDGVGVGEYKLRETDIGTVLRPTQEMNFKEGLRYFDSVEGEKYDMRAIMCFLMLARSGEGKRQICSEFATNFYRKCGLTPFHEEWPADRTPPSYFLASPNFKVIWKKGEYF